MRTLEKRFNEILLPFMSDGNWHTAEQLTSTIPLKFRKNEKIALLLSDTFSRTTLLKRIDKRRVHFTSKVVNHGRWAYRLRTTSKDAGLLPSHPSIQLSLPLHDQIIQDSL